MGIAYSPPDQVVLGEFVASSSLCLRQGLHGTVTRAGWAVDREIEDGYVYILTSPQVEDLQIKVQIQDTGRQVWHEKGCIDVTFMSMDELLKSHAYYLYYTDLYELKYRVHAGPCQIFTYRVGVPSSDDTAVSVMGGIPFLDPNVLSDRFPGFVCADEDRPVYVYQAFWSGGDHMLSNTFWGAVATFRNHWVCTTGATLLNDTLVLQDHFSGYNLALLRLTPCNRPEHYAAAFGNINAEYPLVMRWWGTEEPLNFDPLLAFGATHPVPLQGQIWDAFTRTKAPFAIEAGTTFDEDKWFAYTYTSHKHWYTTADISTLYLRDPGVTKIPTDCNSGGHDDSGDVPGESNYAY